MKKIFYIIVFLIGIFGYSQTPLPNGARLTGATESDTLSTQTRIPILQANAGNLMNKYTTIDSIAKYITGVTNLSTTQTPTTVTINSDTGTDAPIALGDGVDAGVSINDYTNADKALVANSVQLTGAQTITGSKTFNTGTTLTNIISNNTLNTTGAGILATNSASGGFAISAQNTVSNGFAIYAVGGSGKGVTASVTSTGDGFYANGNSTGRNIFSQTTGSGNSIVSSINTGGTGFAFVGQNNLSNTFTVNKTGDVIGNTFNGVSLTTGGSATDFLNAQGNYVSAGGSGDVSKVGTPLANQIGVWTGDGTIEGISGFEYDKTTATFDIGQTVGGLAKIESGGLPLFDYDMDTQDLTVSSQNFLVSNATTVNFTQSPSFTVPDGTVGNEAINFAQFDTAIDNTQQYDPLTHQKPLKWIGTQAQYDIDFPSGHGTREVWITDATPPAITASEITNTPSGNLSSTNQQDVNNELQSDIDTRLTDALSDGNEYVRKDGSWAIASGGGGTATSITDITEYNTAASLPAVTGTETDTYAMVLFDTDANNGLYTIINGVWKLLVHDDDINWSSVIRPSINEINLRGSIITSTTTATEEGVIVGYKFNIKDTGTGTLTLATDATYYITDFIPIKPKGAVVIGSTANTYWLFDKDKQPLDDADVDYNNRTYGYTTLSGDDEVAYIRWSLPISTIGNGSMAAQLYNVYENNPGQQVTTGWEDYHGKAMGKVQISAGTSGSIDSILADGVEIMSSSVAYATSRSVTATNVAININAHTSSPDYKATAIGEYVLIWTTATDGSTANTYTIVSSATTLTTVDTNMSGGLSEPYKRDNTRYVFESNGIIWKKPTNNLYDYRFGEYPRNYQATGVVSTSNGSSGFIPCKGLRPYTLSTGANTQISFYTADKVFISGTTDWDGFVTPTTARYFTLQMSRALNFKSINVTQSTYTQSTTYKETGEELISSNYPVNKSLCLIGDSIGTEGITYASVSSYASRLATALGFNDFVNLSVSGKSLNQFAADINSGRQTAPVSDIYIIALGTNDHAFNRPLGSLGDTAATDSFFGDIQELVEAIQALNPNAEIAFITNGRRGTSATTTEWNTTTSLWLEQFAGAIESYALENSHEYINLYEKSLANPQRSVINTNYYVSADATHLNNDGHDVFYFPLVSTMMKKLAK